MNVLIRFSCLMLVLATSLRCGSEGGGPMDLDDPESPPAIPGSPMARIQGVVTDGGSPISGAQVSLTGPEIARTARSGRDGGFAFVDLPPGLYTLTVLLSGFACEPATTEMEAGETVTASIACLRLVGTIRGTVAADGTPISGALVRMSGGSATTDSDGAFVFEAVPVGRHTLTVSTPNAHCPAASVTVAPNETVTADIVCALITGLRVNVHGPPGFQWVFLLFVTGPEKRTGTGILGSQASFAYSGLPPGEYAVAVGVASDLNCESTVATLELGRGTTVDIDCTSRSPGPIGIRGRVAINGAGRELVPVELRDRSGTSLLGLAVTVAFERGDYAFRGVPPGLYRLVMTPPAGAPCDETTTVATVAEDRETIVNFTCTSETTGSIAGFIDSENFGDQQLAGRRVGVTGPVNRATTTGPFNGVYALDDLPPGDYAVTSWCGQSMNVTVQAGQTATASMLCF